MRQRSAWVGILLVLGVALGGTLRVCAADDGKWRPLFNGKDFTGWQFVWQKRRGDAGKPLPDPKATWSVSDAAIHCTGQPIGYVHTEAEYGGYVLRYEWRYVRPADLKSDDDFQGNSGCLVHIRPPHKVWPRCVEVQGMNKDHGQLLFIPRKLEGTATYDRPAHDKAVRPVGQWNTTEVTCGADGSIAAKINGVEVSQGRTVLTRGQIGFQSEGAAIDFRKIELKPLAEGQ